MVAQDGCIYGNEGDCDSEKLSSWPKATPRRAGTWVGLLCPSKHPEFSAPVLMLQTHVCSRTHTHTHIYAHVCKHKYMHTRIRTLAHPHKTAYACTHARTHEYSSMRVRPS